MERLRRHTISHYLTISTDDNTRKNSRLVDSNEKKEIQAYTVEVVYAAGRLKQKNINLPR